MLHLRNGTSWGWRLRFCSRLPSPYGKIFGSQGYSPRTLKEVTTWNEYGTSSNFQSYKFLLPLSDMKSTAACFGPSATTSSSRWPGPSGWFAKKCQSRLSSRPSLSSWNKLTSSQNWDINRTWKQPNKSQPPKLWSLPASASPIPSTLTALGRPPTQSCTPTKNRLSKLTFNKDLEFSGLEKCLGVNQTKLWTHDRQRHKYTAPRYQAS